MTRQLSDVRSEDDENPFRELGLRLESARRARGWTYREMAVKLGLTKSSLHYLIWRKTTPLDYYEMHVIVQRLGGSWDDWEPAWRNTVRAAVARNKLDHRGPATDAGPTRAEPSRYRRRRRPIVMAVIAAMLPLGIYFFSKNARRESPYRAVDRASR